MAMQVSVAIVKQDHLILNVSQMSQILEEIARIAGITAEDVWIYLQDIPATQMIEFGRFLPAPGDEAEWEREMTPEKRSSLPK
jgi:hypothetical protein